MSDHLKILVVEDSHVTLEMEIETLKDLGYKNVIGAANGKDAIRQLRKTKDVGMIISDWNMPGLNGYELLIWVRSRRELKDIPFVMATAHGERKQADKAVGAGVTGFLTKPFGPEELKAAIDKALATDEKAGPGPAEANKRPRETSSGKIRITAAHIQITDHLVLGVMQHLTEIISPRHFELETLCMPSWNPVRAALEKGRADVAFVLAPIAMDMFASGTDIRVVLFAHRNGSVCIRKKDSGGESDLSDFFKNKTFYIPHILSIHHMLSDMFLREIGLSPGLVGREGADVFFEVAPPVKMPDFLSRNPNAGGFMVAEPVGSAAISAGAGELMYLSGELWENHPCCVVAMRRDFIEKYEDAAYEFVQMLVEAGWFVVENIEASAEIALDFLDPARKLGYSLPVLESVLKHPFGVKTGNMFPDVEDLDAIQRYIHDQIGIGTIVDVEKFVDTKFAEAVRGETKPGDLTSVLHRPEHIIGAIAKKTDLLKKQTVTARARPPKKVFEITEGETSISFAISSEKRMAVRIDREVKEFLLRFGIEACPELSNVLNELLANAIEHGNEKDEEKKVACSVVRVRDLLFRITVKDEGKGFDYKQFENSIVPDSVESRRGFDVIRSLSEQVEFGSGGKEISALIRIPRETVYYTWDENGWTVVQPTGNITASSADELKRILVELVESGQEKYRFDFERVEDIDSISLTIFVVFIKMLARRKIDSELEIINSSGNIENLFSMTRLDRHYIFT